MWGDRIVAQFELESDALRVVADGIMVDGAMCELTVRRMTE
jgi:hypothetical protein